MDDVTPELDAIVAQTEASTNQDIPMEAPAPTEPTPEAQPQTPQEWEFEAEGRKYKGDIQKLIRWAQSGVSAPNKIGELSKKIQDFQSKEKEWSTYEQTYKPIDEWAKKNPDKWQTLFSSWQQAQYGVLPQNQTAEAPQPSQLPPELIQKINQFEQRFSQLDQQEQVQRETKADQGLDQEIQSIRKQYSNLDFDAPDETGNSLEYQILKHATENGIPSFRAAFRDYCFDKLSQITETKGMEKASSAMPAKTKAGLLGKDPQAQAKAKLPSQLVKGMNYDQIHHMILENELGISAG